MKKLILMLLILMMTLSAAFAEGENTLLRYAIELGRELDALADDEAHARQYTAEPEVLEIVRSYGEGNHDTPIEVREASLDEVLAMMPTLTAGMSEAGTRQMQNMLPRMLLQSCINSFGVKMVVANTILHVDVTFALPGAEGQGLWVLAYENAAPIGVAWYAENGAVHMEAVFLPDDVNTAMDTRVIAAARPELDAYALSLADELQSLALNRRYLLQLGLPAEVVGIATEYPADDPTPHTVLCALTDDPQAVNALLTQQIAYLGDSTLAAAGSLHATVIFANEESNGTGLYIFLYEDGVPVIVTWKGENGAYYLSAAFQPGEFPASCRTVEDTNAWAKSIGLDVRFQEPGAMLLP